MPSPPTAVPLTTGPRTDKGRLHDFITYGVTEEERRTIGNLPVGEGILGALITEAYPLRLRRIQDDQRSVGFPPNHPPMTSFLGVPVSVRGRVYGNLYLTEKRDAPEFTADDERAVVTLAAQAGVAIENARLLPRHRNGWRSRRGIAWPESCTTRCRRRCSR
jgi:signal transduction protein with GAF and PtsI domain